MSRPERVGYIAVIPGSLVLIAYQKRDWGTGCFPLKDTGENLYCIWFTALCCIFALPGSSSVKKCLNYICIQSKPGRAPVLQHQFLLRGIRPRL